MLAKRSCELENQNTVFMEEVADDLVSIGDYELLEKLRDGSECNWDIEV